MPDRSSNMFIIFSIVDRLVSNMPHILAREFWNNKLSVLHVTLDIHLKTSNNIFQSVMNNNNLFLNLPEWEFNDSFKIKYFCYIRQNISLNLYLVSLEVLRNIADILPWETVALHYSL